MLKPLDLKVSLEEEIKKSREENEEFIQAVLKNDNENMVEEYWDNNQVNLNLLDMKGITEEEIIRGFYKHLDKMRSRGYQFKNNVR